MFIKGHKLEKRVEVRNFLDLLSGYKTEYITCTGHTFFRLSEAQRKLFKCEHLKEYILRETPIFVGL